VNFHLFIPDFFAGISAAASERLSAVETLIARGRRKRLPAISPEAWLFGRFSTAKQTDWPVAPYALLADGGAPGHHFWLRADPVHLRAGRERMLLMDSSAFEISRAEAEALVETLNRHFGDTAMFHAPAPNRWYLRPRDPLGIETTPLTAARTQPLEACLARGGDALRAHALMNEAQMLLHEHPVNVAREARGAPAVNGVWLWGGGAIDAPGGGGALVAPGARPFDIVFGDDPLARGLALAAGIPARTLPRDAEATLGALAQEGVALIALDVLQAAADPADAARLREAMECDWFVPLLAALESGHIGMLTLHLPGTDALLEVETVRQDLRYFWRRRKPLPVYA